MTQKGNGEVKKYTVTLLGRKPKVMRIAEDDRPENRIYRLGAKSLTFVELLAVLLNDAPDCMEIAEEIASVWPTAAALRTANPVELARVRGLRESRVARILAVFELAGRALEIPDERPAVHSPGDAANLVLYEMSALEQEELWVLLFDTHNRFICKVKLYRGSASSAQVKVGEIFKEAIIKNAPQIIIAHNHPSGDPTPSPDDVALTRAIVQAGKGLDIGVLDHIVVGQGKWVSLKERGLGFTG